MTSSKPNCHAKAPPPHTTTLGDKASTYEFGGDTNIQYVTPAQQNLKASLSRTKQFPSKLTVFQKKVQKYLKE